MVWLSSFVLGVALFWPLRMLMLAVIVSWYQHTSHGAVTHEEITSLRYKTSIIAAVAVIASAWFYARFVMSLFHS